MAEIATNSTNQMDTFRKECMDLFSQNETRTMDFINERLNSVLIDESVGNKGDGENLDKLTDAIMKEVDDLTNIPKNLLPGISPVSGTCTKLPSTSTSSLYNLRPSILSSSQQNSNVPLPVNFDPCCLELIECRSSNKAFKASELMGSFNGYFIEKAVSNLAEAIKDYARIMTNVRRCQFSLKCAAQDFISTYDANKEVVETYFPPEYSAKIKKAINGTIRRYAKSDDPPKVIPHSAFRKNYKKKNNYFKNNYN
ncbi:unnamed protein product [Chironomus riparius]|uniref:Uncharacterized protein n=1 Tax=Chironomus riparius TaxID=315576 RepID=A0A9P0JB99_9DIPT|nr:unnamed protein product [Chironomus riparius]